MSEAENPNLRLHAGPSTLGGALGVFVRHRSPQIIATIFAAALGARIYVGTVHWVDLVILAGIIAVWPFLEWMIHVFILHARPRKIGPWTLDPFAARKHRAHHRDPWRFEILFFPTRVFVWVLPVVAALWYVSFELPQALTGLAGVFGVLLHYEWVHFMSHTRYKPKLGPYQKMWRQHRLHHCKNEHYWQGVTTRMGDRLFGTLPKSPNDVPTSPTCRTLGYEEDLGVGERAA